MDLIRKIIAGTDPLKALAYYVGQKAGDGEIDSIILDGSHLHTHGERRYLIYLTKNDSIMLWKSIEGMPTIIEYDCNF
jgi:hypothetical protein